MEWVNHQRVRAKNAGHRPASALVIAVSHPRDKPELPGTNLNLIGGMGSRREKEVMSWHSVSSIGDGVFAMLQGFLNRERLSYDFLLRRVPDE